MYTLTHVLMQGDLQSRSCVLLGPNNGNSLGVVRLEVAAPGPNSIVHFEGRICITGCNRLNVGSCEGTSPQLQHIKNWHPRQLQYMQY